MSKRVVGIIIKDNRILLMRRVRDGREYFVFPGGGVEENESIEEAIIREIQEELSINAKIEKLLFEIENQGRREYYYLIKEFSGQPKLGGEEKERMNKNNQYYPIWTELNKLRDLDNLYPELAKVKVLRLFRSEFDKVAIS